MSNKYYGEEKRVNTSFTIDANTLKWVASGFVGAYLTLLAFNYINREAIAVQNSELKAIQQEIAKLREKNENINNELEITRLKVQLTNLEKTLQNLDATIKKVNPRK